MDRGRNGPFLYLLVVFASELAIGQSLSHLRWGTSHDEARVDAIDAAREALLGTFDIHMSRTAHAPTT